MGAVQSFHAYKMTLTQTLTVRITTFGVILFFCVHFKNGRFLKRLKVSIIAIAQYKKILKHIKCIFILTIQFIFTISIFVVYFSILASNGHMSFDKNIRST